MNSPKEILKKIGRPPLWIAGPLIPASTGLLILGFSEPFKETAVAYISYLVSAYTLWITTIGLPGWIRKAKKAYWNLSIIQKINRTRIGHLFLNDLTFRGTLSMYQGLVVNTVYAVFRGVTACLYRSAWFAAIAAYYMFLSLARLSLVYYVNRSKRCGNPALRVLWEYKGTRACGFLILLLHTGMAGLAVQMIRDNLHNTYPGYIIYLSAAYTFYAAITATIHIFKFRKLKSPILSASKAIAFTGAMMSVMALQTAMIARFGADDAVFRQVANTITGSVVCIGSVLIALFMIVRASKKIKEAGLP